MKYDPKKIEKKWQKFWQDKKTFFASEKAKGKKKMILVEFPYPSGAGLHMGHMRPFVAGDVVSKFYKLQGMNAMYPIGWDAFGLPAENYAIKNKVHPRVSTKKNIENAKKQLISWGTGYDWSREINTTDPEYYKWTQKIFLEFWKAGLAYEKEGEINWCPKDKTGLANEEVVDGKCERCGAEVEKKNLRQWYLKITDYAEKLLDGLSTLPEWPNAVKTQQENWIGRSEGSQIRFKIYDLGIKNEIGEIEVFTTRADTLFGVTYVVLAPETAERFMYEDLRFKNEIQNKGELENYIKDCKNKSDEERTNDKKEKTGVEIKGIKAINPANGEEVPIWVADYVLGHYGTGAVMAVPAHDERDFEFAKKYNLQIKEVVVEQLGNYEANSVERVAARAVIIKDGKILVEIKEDKKHMILPGGGIDQGETNEVALKREIMEEGGFTDIKVHKLLTTITISKQIDEYLGNKNAYVNFVHNIYEAELLSEQKTSDHEDRLKFVKIEEYLKHVEASPIQNRELSFTKRVIEQQPFVGNGRLVASAQFSNLTSEEARKKITEFVGGKIVTKYKLRDWVFSRQRYWGEPIPLIHCEKCGVVPVPEKDLPVKLPEVKKYEPTGTGESPLAAIESWVKTECPACKENQKKTKYLVFDYDGVIGDTYKAGLKARVECGWSKDLEDSKLGVLSYFTRKPRHVRGGDLTKEELLKLHKESLVYGESVAKSGHKLFEKFVAEVKKIKNARIAVISSGSIKYSGPMLKKSKLKIDKVLTFEDSFSKEEKLEKLEKIWKVPVTEMYYFTDANCDVFELENFMDRKKIIGCSWGYLGKEKLLEALPENQILNTAKDIHKLFLPGKARRETNTMPQWAGSSWYWLRYMDAKNKKEFSSLKNQKYWSPVDMYFGGMEHTTLHLLYSRFWNLFLYNRKLVAVKEPYKKRVPHGIILGPDGEKMSKSRGNVVNPDELVARFGADTVRVYMMFLGPHGAQVAWNDQGIVGARRFIERVHGLLSIISKTEPKEVRNALHKTIKKVQEDTEGISFNTAISAMMIFVNTVYEAKQITRESLVMFTKILSPFAPHIAEEIWQSLGEKGSIFESKYPKYKEEYTMDASLMIPIQINGKMKCTVEIESGAGEEEVKKIVLLDPKVQSYLGGKEVIKVIVVKDRIVNIVVKP